MAYKKLIIKLLKKELQRLAWHANMHDRLGATYPCAIRYAAERKKVMEVLKEFAADKVEAGS